MLKLLRPLIALLGLVLLTANTASAAATVSAQNPTSGSRGVSEALIQVNTLATTERIGGNLGLRYDLASDSPVAARGGPYGHLVDHASVGPGKPFTQGQKQQILAENRAKNGGELRDDRTGEVLVPSEQSQRGLTPPSNEAQIDHVYPRSRGGPNAYSNAEVRSRANNNKKRDLIEE
jgi:hypothetical protein